jgi:hypothetical protein
LASQEGLFFVTLIVIHCNDLTVTVLKMYKEAAVISALMKVYSIACHDRGHINVMLVLQSCTDSLQVLPGSSSEMFPTSSDGTCNFCNTEVEEDVVVKEECFIAIKEELDIDIKKEEIPEDIHFPDIKSEPGEVSYVCVCVCVFVIRHIFPMSSIVTLFCLCQYFLPLETVPLLEIKVIVFNFLWWRGVFGVGGRVCTGWVSLHVIADKMKIYFFSDSVEITNKMQPCIRIYYSTVH